MAAADALMLPSRRFRRFDRAEIEQSIAARFEAQVRAGPQRLAAQCGADSLTYGRLNEAANRIAHDLLQRRGAAVEPVAVVLGQGTALLAAILGVLKAGKLYVPLEHSHPRERFVQMLRASRAAVAIAGGPAATLLHGLAPALQIVDPGDIDPGLPADDPRLEVAPDAPAYIYFTTGSTGEPKGVVDSQRNVLHNVMRYSNALAIGDDDRLTLLQSPSFSGAVSSMFAALLNGAASFPFDVRTATPAQLADYVDRSAITVYHSVPAIFRSFLRTPRVFASVRIIRLEGDQSSRFDLELFRRHFGPECTLVNGLGTTETGIVRQFFVNRDTPIPHDVVPIGYPVQDMDVQVLTDDGKPAPFGAAGDIAVSSRYLAVGYWQRDDLTAQAFVADPADPARRRYRTGDIGRMHADGCLEHLGRKDALTKVRGVMVALADVESALGRLASIREAAVAVKPGRLGEHRLIAYCVPQPGTIVNASAIRRELVQRLAPQMIPSAYVAVDRLPLNENLKVDRGALPDAPHERPLLDQALVAPRTVAETRLAHLYEQLLQVAPVGVLDDFFDLGGDSLLAIELIAAIAESFGVELPLSALAAGATIERIATVLVNREFAQAPIVALQSEGRKPPFYFLHGDYVDGGRFCRDLARDFDPERPFFAVTPCGLDGDSAPDSIEEMAERHLRALRERQPQGPYYLGGNCNGGLVAIEMARRLVASGERVERLVVFRATARNARFAALRSGIERCGGLLRVPAARQRTAVRHLRWFLEAWATRTPSQRLGLLFAKLARAPLWRRPGAAVPARFAGGAPSATELLAQTYMSAASNYIPLGYDGPLAVLWPEREADLESADEALAGWRRIAPAAELEIVPGDHLAAVTVHAKVFAERVAARLAGP
ncbi:MAG: AMP-binding protein [Gammaproteobacteria bacterium]